MIQIKQIDWTSGRIPQEAFDSGCRVMSSTEAMDDIPEKERMLGMLVYVTGSHTMYTLIEEESTKVRSFVPVAIGQEATDDDVVRMFTEATGKKPEISTKKR